LPSPSAINQLLAKIFAELQGKETATKITKVNNFFNIDSKVLFSGSLLLDLHKSIPLLKILQQI
jgi:hypothetical protein